MATSVIKQVTNNSGTGYCKMPDGTLIQWAGISNVKSGDTIPYPIPFESNNGLRVFIQPMYNTFTTIQCNFVTADVTKDSFKVYAYDTSTKVFSTSTTLQFHWMVIGRWK